jgi:N-acetylneuraminate synthase
MAAAIVMEPMIAIAGRRIGPGERAYIIAELSANHGGSLERALAVVRAAADAGADALKMQTYTADTLTIRSSAPEFVVGGGTIWEGRTLHDLYAEAYTPWEWQPALKRAAEDAGLHCFSTPFDASAVEFLERLDVPAYKIASFELVDVGLIDRVARTEKPILASTGMATLAEIEEAVAAVSAAGGRELALLKCTSAYPAPPESMNLKTIPDLRARFGVPVGLSDHTLGVEVPVAATAVGACIIEKHLTLSRSEPGPDSAFSLEPHEFRDMVRAVRAAERALGTVSYGPTASDRSGLAFRRSLFVVEDMKAGDRFTERNVRSIRPGHGLHPRHLRDVLNRTAACDIRRGTPLTPGLVDDAGGG